MSGIVESWFVDKKNDIETYNKNLSTYFTEDTGIQSRALIIQALWDSFIVSMYIQYKVLGGSRAETKMTNIYELSDIGDSLIPVLHSARNNIAHSGASLKETVDEVYMELKRYKSIKQFEEDLDLILDRTGIKVSAENIFKAFGLLSTKINKGHGGSLQDAEELSLDIEILG